MMVAAVLSVAAAPAAQVDAAPAANGLASHLDAGLPNRDASRGPGAPNPDLPQRSSDIAPLLAQARSEKLDPSRYGALLYTYWLERTTEKAGIDLQRWNPRAGATANLTNLERSYRYYEDLQLAHRELRWAGMAGQVGADFGGGLLDLELGGQIFEISRLQPVMAEIVRRASDAGGDRLVAELPDGVRALAEVGKTITPADIDAVIGQILVMQKNIFGDLMPLHTAYVVGGLDAVRELVATGLYPADVLDAFVDIASGDSDRVSAGNGRLLRREQETVIARQWDQTRAYRAPVGEALTYASTIVGSPSVAGVRPMRAYRPIEATAVVGGRTVRLTTPLPSWNWSVFDARWEYINAELLPKYAWQVDHNWDALAAYMRTPYSRQLQEHRVLFNLGPLATSILDQTKVTVK
ncbi:hypothetical protein nbrc107696_35920 [Gordonia spumicola]|uniref:Uncharacterized protein n=2 Tax=Gordonia spumicola TaxID=589161 RepID=A0A7I9VCQ0_9ACTN|nr:hypothetical protein nbrc107696_35920 [Gordonia spumicola]